MDKIVVKKERETILFISACPRSKTVSRTRYLCDLFIKQYQWIHEDVTVILRDLTEYPVPGMDYKQLELRQRLLNEGKLDDPIFALAREFAAADKIIIGAPYWNMLFPATLQAYIENICVEGISYCNTRTGTLGLSTADELLYITTSGRSIGEDKYGIYYIEEIGKMMGIGKFHYFAAERLDEETSLQGESPLEAVKKQLIEFAEEF